MRLISEIKLSKACSNAGLFLYLFLIAYDILDKKPLLIFYGTTMEERK